jgi:hypothetical protein
MGSGYSGRKVPDTKFSTIIVGTPKTRKTLKPFSRRRYRRQTAAALPNKNEKMTQ